MEAGEAGEAERQRGSGGRGGRTKTLGVTLNEWRPFFVRDEVVWKSIGGVNPCVPCVWVGWNGGGLHPGW